MRGGKGPPRPLLLWNRRHIVQNRATGGSRPRSEATALLRPPSPYLQPFQRNPLEHRVLRRCQCWFAGTTNERGNVPLIDHNGQEEVALPENRHPILQGVGTSLHRARIRDIRNILVGTLRGLGVRHDDGSCFDATAHARKLLPQAPAALSRTPQRVRYGGWEASQHWNVKPFAVLGPPWAFRLFGSAAPRFYWYCFLFRPRQGGSRPHISEGSDFSDFSSACRCAASRAAPNLKRADSILRSKMPFTWVGPPRLDPRPGDKLEQSSR